MLVENKLNKVVMYIVNYCNENKIEITPEKLLKVLYYSQIHFYRERGGVCFEEEIIRTPTTIEIPAISEYLSKYENSVIPTVTEYTRIREDGKQVVVEIESFDELIDMGDALLIEDVIIRQLTVDTSGQVEILDPIILGTPIGKPINIFRLARYVALPRYDWLYRI